MNMITLTSTDGQSFHVEKASMMQCVKITNLVEENVNIPLENITGNILAKVIEYCKKHAADGVPEEDLKVYDADFLNVDQHTLFNLIIAAHSLGVNSLLDLTCQAVADMIKGKSSAELAKIFNIKSDFTPEEEEEIYRNNSWAFE